MLIATKIKNVIKQYLISTINKNELLSSYNIKAAKDIVANRNPYLPLSGNYRLFPFEQFDIDSFNAELDMLEIDRYTINDSIEDLFNTIEQRILMNQILKKIYDNKSKKIIGGAVSLTSSNFIEGFTTLIDFKKDINIQKSNATIDNTLIQIPVENINFSTSKTYTDEQISITIDEFNGKLNDGKYDPEVKGVKSTLLDTKFNNGVFVNVFSLLTEQISVNFTCTVNVQDINNIVVHLNEPEMGQVITLAMVDYGGKLTPLYSNLIKSNSVSINLPNSNIAKFIVKLTQKIANTNLGGVMQYKFNLNKIRFLNTTIKKNCEVITNKINIKTDTKIVSLLTEEELLPNTNIQYQVAYDKDDQGNPINFIDVIPTTRANQNKLENYIKIGSNRFVYNIDNKTKQPTSLNWNYLKPFKDFGSKLYEILDLNQFNSSLNINNIKIVEDSIKLYRGINDWSVTRTKVVNDIVYKKTPYYPIWDNIIKGYNHLDIYITREEDIQIYNLGLKQILLAYEPGLHLDYYIVDNNFNRISIQIVDTPILDIATGKYIVSLSKLDSSVKYRIVYNHKLIDLSVDRNISILKSILYTDTTPLVQNIDYFIVQERDSFKIHIAKNGNFKSDKFFADFIVRFEEKNYSKLYTCYITCNKSTTIEGIPFNKNEIDKGNFHKINNIDISNQRSYNILPGKYTIQTTQPIEGLINQHTRNVSSAGLKIPSDIDMFGYEESLRKVSMYELALNSTNDDRQFSFYNNKLYINRIPDYINSNDVNLTTTLSSVDLDGKFLKCLYKDSFSGEYKNRPESFRLVMDYSTENTDRSFYIKALLTNMDDTISQSPKIYKIGLNEYNISDIKV